MNPDLPVHETQPIESMGRTVYLQYLHLPLKSTIHVGKCAVDRPMDGMGRELEDEGDLWTLPP